MTTPPGGYPDEIDHYVRAVAIGQGELRGEPDPTLESPDLDHHPTKACCKPPNANVRLWVAEGSRLVRIPADLAPEGLACTGEPRIFGVHCDLVADEHGEVRHLTDMGTVEPAMYALPGLATRLAHDPMSGLRLARLVNTVIALALLGAAVVALTETGRSPLPALGLLVAASPMVLYVGSSVSANSAEVSAGLAFVSVLLRLTRPTKPSARPRWLWVALGVAGVILAVSRSLGPFWIALDVALVVLLRGRPSVVQLLREDRRRAELVGVVVAIAVVTTVGWELLFQPTVHFDAPFFVHQVGPSIDDLRSRVWQELVGVFASLTVRMSAAAYTAWAVIFGVLAAMSLVHATRRERLAMAAGVVAVVVVAIGISAGIMNQNGFGLQGRHFLAVAVTAPLIAGEVLERHHRTSRAAGAFLGLTALTVALVQLHAFVRAGDRFGWRAGRLPASWLPPGGELPWVIVAAVGAGCIGLGGLILAGRVMRDRAT